MRYGLPSQKDIRANGTRGEASEDALRATSSAFRTVIAAIVIACGCAESSRSKAADDAGSFVAYGLGNKPCGDWLDARRNKDLNAVRMEAWALGFVTAYNKYVHDEINVLKQMKAGDIFEALDRHCIDRIRDSLSFATNAVIERANAEQERGSFDGLMDLFRPRKRN